MHIADCARTRHATKAFDPTRQIPEATFAELRSLLRYSPSSVNSQPWHFIVATSSAGKARIAKATNEGYAVNAPKILNASHVIVLCARTELDDAYLATLLDQEERDGRFATPEGRATQSKVRGHYVDLHREQRQDVPQWTEKQVYLALGALLLGAAALGIDACPMEGFDPAVLDAELGLREKKLRSIIIVSLGYRSAEDFNAKLPKSRLPEQAIFTSL